MGKNAGQVQETPQQRAMLDIAIQKVQVFRQKYAPLLRKAGADITRAGEAGSFERHHGAGMALTDTAAKFSGAGEAAIDAAAAKGALGGSGQKLALTGLSQDQAVSSGFAATRADQAGDNATVGGLGAVIAAGQGQESSALQGMQKSADLSGQQAEADAAASLQNRIGEASTIGRVVGVGAGLYGAGGAGEAPVNDYNFRGTTLPNELRGGR